MMRSAIGVCVRSDKDHSPGTNNKKNSSRTQYITKKEKKTRPPKRLLFNSLEKTKNMP